MTTAAIDIVVVHVVGCLGAGKSTLLKRAVKQQKAFMTSLRQVDLPAVRDWNARDMNVIVLPEDPTRWKNAAGESLLDLRMADPEKYAADFQTCVLTDRFKSLTDAVVNSLEILSRQKNKILILTEGSIHTDHSVYARACFEKGFMSESQWANYSALYDKFSDSWCETMSQLAATHLKAVVNVQIGGTLFLHTPIDETRNQIVARGRECEKDIPIAYLEDITDRHEYLMKSSSFPAQPSIQIVHTPLTDRNSIFEIK